MPGTQKEDIAKIVEICSSFAEDSDWRFSASSGAETMAGDGSFGITLSENETALHVGTFIGLIVRPNKDTIELRGGCFNMYYQPATVYEEFVPISSLHPGRLEKALTDMQHRLQKYYRNYVRV